LVLSEEKEMSSTEVKQALENIHTNNYEPNKKKRKSWTILGFQINLCYVPQWNEIRDIFKKNRIPLNRHVPIFTLNELKNVRLADKIAENSDEFIPLLYTIPAYCREYGINSFKNWLDIKDNRKRIKSFEGNILDIDERIERMIQGEL